jgi:flavin-dependent dehydrogenase
MAYDVIVVGARVAGAATAMLLARQGVRVLALDRARFPSDTISTHQIQLPGTAKLRRWGLLDKLLAAGTPATREVRLDVDGATLVGAFGSYQGINTLVSPRRTVLDAQLVNAAREAGAEVREGVRVDGLEFEDGRVVGVRTGMSVERAPLVVGADGKHSLVAAAVKAQAYGHRAARTFATYAYWAGAPLERGELYQRPGFSVAAFPTNDGLTIAFLSARLEAFAAARRDLERHYLDRLDECGDLGARLRAGTRVERLRTTPDLPNGFRTAYGPGWALVGDAGVVLDPVSAQGISNAFRDAEYLADAVVAGRRALAAYGRRRDRAVRPTNELTLRLAELAPSERDRRLARALDGRPAEVSKLLGVFAGVVPAWRLLTPGTLARLALR